jgi:hypothetical protein
LVTCLPTWTREHWARSGPGNNFLCLLRSALRARSGSDCLVPTQPACGNFFFPTTRVRSDCLFSVGRNMSGTRYNGLSITCHVIATSSIDSIKDYPLKGQVLTLCLKSTHNTYFITLAFHLYSFSFFIFTESTTRSQAQQPPARHRTCSSATSPAALVLSQPIAWRTIPQPKLASN